MLDVVGIYLEVRHKNLDINCFISFHQMHIQTLDYILQVNFDASLKCVKLHFVFSSTLSATFSSILVLFFSLVVVAANQLPYAVH